MKPVKVMVLRSAGTNCDREAVYAWQLAGAEPELIHVNRLIERPAMLHDYQILTLPGGFSYGDDIAAGQILARRLVLNVLDEMLRFVDRGRLILGICNGFQVQVRAGLLPGLGPAGPRITLARNASGRFEDRWVHVEVVTDRCPLLAKGERFYIPIAHAEGCLATSDEESLASLHRENLIALRYITPLPPRERGRGEGSAQSESLPIATAYPHNPNGSTDAIAGLIDPTGRILGLMPHPERHADPTQHPFWTRFVDKESFEQTNGLRVFRRGVDLFRR